MMSLWRLLQGVRPGAARPPAPAPQVAPPTILLFHNILPDVVW
jgi:hypothetical protein